VRRLRWSCLLAALFLLAATHYAAAQVPTPQETAAMDAVTRWKIANTLIFAIGLGYLIAKYAPAFFNARSSEIQKAIQDATGLKIEAEFRSSEIDRKMAGLAEEVKKLRQQYADELEREHERFRRETDAEVQHIQRNVAAEIEALRLEGTRRVRRHTAQVALELAERRLQERATREPQDDLVQDFVHLVERVQT
jgi:F0F1-type ATP synthase membrane subunit b/b'